MMMIRRLRSGGGCEASRGAWEPPLGIRQAQKLAMAKTADQVLAGRGRPLLRDPNKQHPTPPPLFTTPSSGQQKPITSA